MPARKSDLSKHTREARRMRARRARESSEARQARLAVARQRCALTRLLNATYEVPAWMADVQSVDLYPHMCSVNVKQEPEDFANEKLDGCMNEEVDLYTHMCTVNIKQETEDYENEMLAGCVNEEFAEDGLVTTECSVFIKEEPELELDVDTEENDVNKFAEAFVPDWRLASTKQEEV